MAEDVTVAAPASEIEVAEDVTVAAPTREIGVAEDVAVAEDDEATQTALRPEADDTRGMQRATLLASPARPPLGLFRRVAKVVRAPFGKVARVLSDIGGAAKAVVLAVLLCAAGGVAGNYALVEQAPVVAVVRNCGEAVQEGVGRVKGMVNGRGVEIGGVKWGGGTGGAVNAGGETGGAGAAGAGEGAEATDTGDAPKENKGRKKRRVKRVVAETDVPRPPPSFITSYAAKLRWAVPPEP